MAIAAVDAERETREEQADDDRGRVRDEGRDQGASLILGRFVPCGERGEEVLTSGVLLEEEAGQ